MNCFGNLTNFQLGGVFVGYLMGKRSSFLIQLVAFCMHLYVYAVLGLKIRYYGSAPFEYENRYSIYSACAKSTEVG